MTSKVEPRTSERPVVLVADDQAANRALVEATLETESVDVVAVADGEAALAAFRTRPADLLLLDVRMPGRDGFATLEALRALPGGEGVPAIFLTALRDVDVLDRALAVGAEFLTKPVRPVELVGRVRTQLALRRLDVELRAHHEELRRQRDELLRAQLLRERLSAFVVHDLKSPLSAVRLHAQILTRDKNLDAGARESARTIAALTDRLGQLVQNLLDVAKADEGRLEPRRGPVALHAISRSVEATFEVAARERRLVVATHVPESLRILGDEALLLRVFENLVDNALRHAPAGSTVVLEARDDGDEVEVRVRDEGQGVPPAMVERIFDRFVQVEAGAAASRAGHGLGLSFVRTAIEALGGTVRVDPEAPGAVFVVRLPRSP